MAYSDYAISSVTDIPANVIAFAASLGWITNDSTLQANAGALPFTISASKGTGSGTGVFDTVTLTGPNGTNPAVLCSPRWPTTAGDKNTLTPLAPTKLMLHGTLEPVPFIAISIAYGFNLYRHMYVGVLEKLGNYAGGDVISASNFRRNNYLEYNETVIYSNDDGHSFLFRGRTDYNNTSNCGGVKVEHADNPNTWRQFRHSAGFNTNWDWGNTEVFGGFGDSVLESYLARAQMSFSNGVIMVQINLFATETGNRLRPLGRVPGVRMVDLSDIEPESSFALGSESWRVIPVFGKYAADGSSYSNYLPLTKDNSFNIGYAFKK